MIEHECKTNLHTITYQYKCQKPGKFVRTGLDDLMSRDDNTSQVNYECKINLYMAAHLHKCRRTGKFVCPGQDDLMSKDDKTRVVSHVCKINLYTKHVRIQMPKDRQVCFLVMMT